MKYFAGIDMGSAAVRLVLLDAEGRLVWKGKRLHHGDPVSAAGELLFCMAAEYDPEPIPVMLTGGAGGMLSGLEKIGDVPAIQKGVELLCPKAKSAIEIGAQNARFLTGLGTGMPPEYAVNEGCAGGTGAFFEDQMYRLGFKLEDYSALAQKAQTIPRLSGRCSVFAKTDIIHRQQEGVPAPDILLGLCYAAVKNFKAAVVRNLPVEKPLALCGGIVHNQGVVRAVADLFGLKDGELLAHEDHEYAQAAGAAVFAAEQNRRKRKICTLGDLRKQLTASTDRQILDERILNGQILGCRMPGQAEECLPPLTVYENTIQKDPVCKELCGTTQCFLGIDVGSTSTNLVLLDQEGELLDFQYLRTRGDPKAAVEQGMKAILEKYGERAVISRIGVTGSGRYLIGRQVGADLVVDEITAQGKAAVCVCSKVDTVFEIGGQDSKYIQIDRGEIQDFQMNKICAAGTGSFLEEQAGRMQIPLEKYGELALSAKHSADLGERCSVFIESSIQSSLSRKINPGDILAGLCYSIIHNYLHKVVGSKKVGDHIVLQGGVCYNPAVVAAFQSVYGDRIFVSPYFSVSGAYGAARLAAEAVNKQEEDEKKQSEAAAFYRKSREYFMDGYSRQLSGKKQVVGIPYVLMVHKFFPMFRRFFECLGYEVLLSPETSEEIIALAQSLTQAETCYPVKLMYGHMTWLAQRKPDYIFLPSILTMKHETSKVYHNYGCVYMQTAPRMVFDSIGLGKTGIRLLNPVFHLDFGQQAMAGEMIGIGKILGHGKEESTAALMQASMAVRKYTEQIERLGAQLIAGLKPEEKALVMVTRNYGIEDPVLNMGIPDELLKRGYKVITLSHLPAHSLDLSEEYDNMYWPFGQHILSGAKLIAAHPNLYAVYLTNHGCGPDTMLSHLFRKEMGEKPYLSIEVDEHFSKVGMITRIEAFLNSLKTRKTEAVPAGSQCFSGLSRKKTEILPKADKKTKLYLPYLEPYSEIVARRLQSLGYQAESLPKADAETLAAGRERMMSKEYLPFTALAGAAIQAASRETEPFQLLIPQTEGSETDGVYARVLYEFLDHKKAVVVGTVAETMPWELEPEVFDQVFEGILEGDRKLLEQTLPGSAAGRKPMLLIGDPYLLYHPFLNHHVLEMLREQGIPAVCMPLGEYLAYMWKQRAETEEQKKLSDQCMRKLCQAAEALGERSPYAENLDQIRKAAGECVGVLTGGNAAYRLGKRICSSGYSGILELAPMYENAQTIIDLCGKKGQIPVLSLRLEESNEQAVHERLESFLFYR